MTDQLPIAGTCGANPLSAGSEATDRPQVPASNPLDLDPQVFRAALERRAQNRSAMIHWIKDNLTDGVDFGTITFGRGDRARESKPSLRKPGAEKICGMLGVIAQFPDFDRYVEAAVSGVAIDHVILKCYLFDGSGKRVADGIGSRTLSQDNGDLNKTLKMATKSAMIDAVLRMAGLSEIFTQDLEDMQQQDGDAPPSTGRPMKTAAPVAAYRHDAMDYPTKGKYRKGGEQETPWSMLELKYLEFCLSAPAAPQELKAGAKYEIERRQEEANSLPTDADIPFEHPARRQD